MGMLWNAARSDGNDALDTLSRHLDELAPQA